MPQSPILVTTPSVRRELDTFVVAPFIRLHHRTGYAEALPVGAAHAKTYGTTRTLCGLEASSWHRLWDQPFPASGGDPCPRCLERLDHGGAGVRRPIVEGR